MCMYIYTRLIPALSFPTCVMLRSPCRPLVPVWALQLADLAFLNSVFDLRPHVRWYMCVYAHYTPQASCFIVEEYSSRSFPCHSAFSVCVLAYCCSNGWDMYIIAPYCAALIVIMFILHSDADAVDASARNNSFTGVFIRIKCTNNIPPI